MDFAFNFEPEDSSGCEDQAENITRTTYNLREKGESSALTSYEVTDFHPESVLSKLPLKPLGLSNCSMQMVDTNALEQTILTDTDFKKLVDGSDTLSKVISHSDLEAGVYEGGLKVWECGLDLADFICTDSESSLKIKGAKILELGCGAGIPGVCCLMAGAARVDFQDYNVEVLQLLTQPNVKANTSGQNENRLAETESHFFAGDWASFVDLECLCHVRYDVILSAETIYNVDNYAKLHTVFQRLLSKDGVILLAAKAYYFGVGGSIDAFIEYVRKQKCFHAEVVHTITKGVLRRIVRLERFNGPDQMPDIHSSN